jgi:hypothetical protein
LVFELKDCAGREKVDGLIEMVGDRVSEGLMLVGGRGVCIRIENKKLKTSS